ncbi:MAG: aminopeptidase P family protein [Phycisphaerales bacterium]|jgi:Xaa-Pro aminopeptidase|nr:aminopeptidase P family protein [Phycisphaerales bacterium]
MPSTEISTKLRKLGDFLDRHRLEGVILQNRNNFAWITGGQNNMIPNNSSAGVAAVFATADSRVCLANNIESVRFAQEELKGRGIEVVDYPWYDLQAAGKRIREIIGGRRVAADVGHVGEFAQLGPQLQALPEDFRELRWSLTPEEIERYREGGARASRAMELACHQVQHGMSEHEIAGLLDHEVRRTGCTPVVTLVAADGRIERYRHPIPTDQRVEGYVMLVSCAEFGGLISNLTRFVSFRQLSAELRHKQQAVVNVDLAVNAQTRPGRTLGQVFADLQKAYADNGHPDQWRHHHQGGSTGYAGREEFARPASDVVVRDNQAFAWNPSITGVKSEDTMVCTPKGFEFLTRPSDDWPMLTARFGDLEMDRPDILVR